MMIGETVPRDQTRAAGFKRIEEFLRPSDPGEGDHTGPEHAQGGVGVGREAPVKDRFAGGLE
jgi:hypothetical protein